MKNQPTKPIHDLNSSITTATQSNPAVPASHQVFKLGLDVDLHFVVTAIQCERGEIKLAQKFTRASRAGRRGRALIVTTPMRLSPERRRKNDRLDARELCVRLSRPLDGHAHELKPIRIPTPAEQQRRELGRQREFFKRQWRRLENHGRALRIEFEHETLPAGWAGPRKWKQIAPTCSEFVRGQLEPVVAQIRAVKEQLG